MIKKVLIEPRNFASCVVLNDSMLWIVGGKVGKNNTNTSEFVKLNENPVKGPDLPFHISHHSMIQYDKKSIYIIGGLYDDDKYGSGQTWITDPTNGFKIIKGPNLIEPRHSFACGKMIINGKIVLIVAGGITKLGNVFDSVEILDPSSDEGWKIGKELTIISIEFIQRRMESNSCYFIITGPKLPFKIWGSTMVTSPNGKGVIFIGGSSRCDDSSKVMLELKSDSTEWVPLKQKNVFMRRTPFAVSIPDDLKP